MRRNIALSAALIAAVLAGCDKPVAAPSPPSPSVDQVARAKYELNERCAADTRAWFKANDAEPVEPLRVKRGGEITTSTGLDQNHYSRKLNACFAVLVTTSTFPPPNGQVVVSNAIWDVNENHRVAILVQKDFQTVTACEVEDEKCATKAEFEGLARHYMTE